MKNKNSIWTFLFVAAFLFTNAQNNVGIGTANPDASAILQLESTSKGFIAPRMTSGQRTGIVAPANGLLVYDITVNCFFYYSSGWVSLCQTGGATGATGNTGVIGLNGITGATGVTGATGLRVPENNLCFMDAVDIDSIIPVTHLFATSYTVPTGMNLFITMDNGNNPSNFSINGIPVSSLRGTLEGAGDVLTSSNTGFAIFGYLFPAGQITPVTIDLTSPYTVPVGNTLYIIRNFNTITINGIDFPFTPSYPCQPYIIKGGQVISSPLARPVNGYLR